jgi:phage baseplate assembly protein W
VTLRTSAYVELHLWLAATAKSGAEVDRKLEPAKAAYRRSFENDDEDALLARTTRELAACSDDRCAIAAVASQGFGPAYARALSSFATRRWRDRATTAWIGIEVAHAALGSPAAEALFERAAAELGVRWPERPVPVDFVSEAPPPGRTALAPAALATKSACFVPGRGSKGKDDRSVSDARVIDCVLVHGLLATPDAMRGPLYDTLVRELGDRDGSRAWTLVAIHGAAAIVQGWEPRHRSVHRRAAEAVEGTMLDWLANEWRGASGEPVEAFAVRYAARWREAHASP